MWYCTCDIVLHTLRSVRMQAIRPPYVYVVRQELPIDVPFAEAR